MDSSSNIGFSFEYIISIVIILVVCNWLVKVSPQMNSLIVIVAGLFVGYVSLYILNTFFPYLNQLTNSIYQYFTYQTLRNANSMGYVHVWPPILAVLIIFIILLYNRQLG